MKKILCLFMAIFIVVTALPFSVSAAEKVSTNPDAYPDFADLSYGALYAHATIGGDSSAAWQRWHKDTYGINGDNSIRYFFLPTCADDDKVEIYNNYNVAVTIDDIVIEPYTSAIVSYTEGETILAIREKGTANEKKYAFVVYKSDAEASVYINDTTNSYIDANGKLQETDFYSFLIQNKENYVEGADCAIADENGVVDTTVKKIKGRGNTNWKETDKKPFNVSFDEKTTIGHINTKKYSFVSNAKDSTLMRNTIMYNLAYNVDSKYSPDQSYIDFYVNGIYRGSYIACEKIDLGKNSVVSLKDNSDDMQTGFNFLVEVDVWNYAADTYFVSDEGFHVVLKTPDLEDYEQSTDDWQIRYDYIKDKYQELEDALYSGTLSDIEAICDLESLATQYLLQEFGKNCDGGYTSTFFTYNADEDKFYAAPIWDCDSCLGAVDCDREGTRHSTIDHEGWVTRLATYNRTINPLGQAFYVEGTSNKGQTFEELCAELWTEKFLPQIDIILGNADAQGRLVSIDSLADSISKSTYNNYVMWDFMWLCADKNKSIDKEYTADVAGEIEYLKDWTQARADWMTAAFASETPENPPVSTNEIYFKTDLGWDDVHYYVWASGYVPMRWPGEAATLVGTDENGLNIFKADVPSDVTKIIFNNGASGEQTANIDINGDYNLYYTTEVTGRENEAGYAIYNVVGTDYIPETTPSTTNTTPAGTESSDTTESSEPSSNTATQATKPTETTNSPSNPVSNNTSDNTESIPFSSEPSSNTDTIDEYIKGDSNLDSKINIKDVTVIQKHLAKLTELEGLALLAAEVTGDDKITISDATTIQKFIAGLIDKL